jgi:hypothetical protein
MFVALLIVTLFIALSMSTLVALLFAKPIARILARLVGEELAPSWRKYILFATYVVGISGGIRLWDMEKFLTPNAEGKVTQLTSERWIIEIYKSIIDSLQGIAWMLLIFFLFALVAFVIVKGFEMKKQAHKE